MGGYSSLDADDAAAPTLIPVRLDATTKRLLVEATVSSYTAIADGDAVDAADTGTLVFGSDGTNYQVIKTDSDGNLQVDILGGTVTANLSATDNAVLDTIDAVLDTINAKLVTGTVIGDVNLGATDNAVLDDIAANQTDASQKTQVVDGSGNVIGATANALDVNIKSGGAGDGAILDGASASIKATVLDYTNSNPLAVRLTDTDGSYVGAGAGTQYSDGDANDDPTGTVAMGTDGTNVFALLTDASGHLQVDVLSGGGGGTLVSDGDAVNAANTGQMVLGTDGSNYQVIAVDSDGQLQVDIATQDTDDDDITKGQELPLIINENYVFAKTADNWVRMQASDDGYLFTRVLGVYSDGGTSLTLATQADDVVNTTDSLLTSSFGYMFDGTTWDRVRGDSTNGLLVNLGTNNDVVVSATDLDIRDLTNTSDSVAIYGSDDGGTTKRIIKTDAGGAIQVDLEVASVAVTSIAAGDNNIGNVDIVTVPAPLNVVGGGAEATALRVTIANDSTGVVSIDDNGGAITVDGTVTANLSATDNAVLDNIDTDLTTIIGHVDGIEALLGTIDADTSNMATSLGNLDNSVDGNYLNVNMNIAGTDVVGGAGVLAAGVQRVTIATDDEVNNLLGTIDADTSNIVTAVQLIDNSIYVDDADWSADTSSHTLVGGVTQATPSANTDGDTTPLITNALRELRVAIPESDLATAATKHVKKYYTNAGAVTDGIIWSPAAGTRWYVTDIIINVSAAATVTLEDDLAAGDSAIFKAELAANSGISHSFNTPLFSGEDAADLLITTSAGNVYVTVTGYEI